MAWTDLGAWTSRATVTKTRLDQISDNFTELKLHTHDGTDGDGSAFAWAAWTPTWSGLTIGNAVVTARYARIGKLVYGQLQAAFGTTSSFSGSFTATLPVTAAYSGSASLSIGGTLYSDAGTDRFPGIAYLASSTTMGFLTDNITVVNSTTPFTWTNNDKIDLAFLYEGT